MRKLFIAALVAGLTAPASAQDDAALDSTQQRVSYGIGIQVARSLIDQGITSLDTKAFALAIDDALAGGPFRLTPAELQAAMVEYQREREVERNAQATAALERGTAFLAENRERDGITEIEGGLQYRVVEEGTGEVPSETDTVVVHYAGRLLDGTEFDSSYGRGQPTELEVGQVIPGWQQALQLMPTGSKWEIWIPAALAYGPRGAGGRIGPNETLNFDIELIEIK